jgi:hypothetical protein
MDDLMRDVARRHQAEMRARAAEDGESARLQRTHGEADGPIRRSLRLMAHRSPASRTTTLIDHGEASEPLTRQPRATM